MPKYQTYGQYDAKTDEFPDSAEKVLRANEEMAGGGGDFGEGSFEPENEGKESEASSQIKSTARSANEREGLYRGARAVAVGAGLYGATGAVGEVVAGKNGKSFLKGKAPMVAIIVVIGALFAGVGLSQVLMPFHVIESLTEMTDGSFTARSARMPNLARWLFNMDGETKFTTKAKWGGKRRYQANIQSSRIKTRLAAEGIEVDVSGKNTVLKYTRADGTPMTVEADDYSRLWREDAEFRNKMNRGGRSFLGRIAAHIDLTMADFLASHNLTKNLFANWINKVYTAEGQTAKLNDIIKARAPTTKGNFTTTAGEANGGNETDIDFKTKNPEDGETFSIGDKKEAELEAGYLNMISTVASVTTSGVCGTAAVASAITVAKLVMAHTNARGAFSAWGEGVDKAKTKDYGNDSPINTIADEMMARDANGLTALQSETMKSALSGGTYKMNFNAEDITENSTSAMFKGEGFWSNFGLIGVSTKWIIGCAVANIATAAISVVADLASLGTFSFGKFILLTGAGVLAGEVVSRLVGHLVENATTNFCLDTAGVKRGACVYMGAANYNGLNFQNGGGSLATKEKAKSFYKSYKVALADEAELIKSTKSPFDASSSHTFLGSIVSKLGMLAVEMPNLSSVASGLVGIASNSLVSLLPTASAVEEVSFIEGQLREDCANLDFGDFIALGDANCEPWYITDQSMSRSNPEETFNILSGESVPMDGVSLSELNGESEIASGIKMSNQFETDASGNLKIDPDTGREIVKEGSNLSKYISYCAYRSSPFGLVDQNITEAEGKWKKGILSGLKAILSKLPVASGVIAAIDGVKTITTLGWSTGANCVARDGVSTQLSEVEGIENNKNSGEAFVTSSAVNLVSWEELKYAQSYVADDRYMQTVEENYKSPVLAYAEKKGLTRPDDELNLVEYLAKYTGYTPENVQIALNDLEYWTYVAQYDPNGKGPVVAPEKGFEVYELVEPSEVPDGVYLANEMRYIVYADLRSREVATA